MTLAPIYCLLRVLEPPRTDHRVKCRCDCGATVHVNCYALRRGEKWSCSDRRCLVSLHGGAHDYGVLPLHLAVKVWGLKLSGKNLHEVMRAMGKDATKRNIVNTLKAVAVAGGIEHYEEIHHAEVHRQSNP